MDTKEAAELLRLSSKTIRKYARQGIIPTIRRGGRYLFRRQSLLDWAASRERGG